MKKAFLFASPVFILTGLFIGFQVWINRHPGYGALQITSRPESAVYIDGKQIGKTPLCIGQTDCIDPKPLAVKEYTIKLVPSDKTLTQYEEKIKIEKSVLTVVDRIFASGASSETTYITLQKLDNSSKNEILILSTPDKSDVFLDSNPVGLTPLVLKDQTISDHELKLSKRGYKEKTIRVRTAPGYRLVVTVNLGLDDAINILEASPSATPQATESASVSQAPLKKIEILSTPNGFLRVREEASVASKEIGRVDVGETFDVLEEETGWFKIRISEEIEGWVSAQYARIQN